MSIIDMYFCLDLCKMISFGSFMYGKVNGAEVPMHCEGKGLMEQCISKGKSCGSDIINATLAPLMNLPLVKKQPVPFCSRNELVLIFYAILLF